VRLSGARDGDPHDDYASRGHAKVHGAMGDGPDDDDRKNDDL